MLRSFGVDYAQGYFIGKPAPEIRPEGCGRRQAAGSALGEARVR
jgi:EAL domain-containing protein (putative c-di-GMP-specific phosphodiesterase class I)